LVVGCLPGVALYRAGFGNASITIAILGSLAGFLIAFRGVSIRRTFKLLVAIVADHNLPVPDSIYDWVDGVPSDSPVAEEPVPEDDSETTYSFRWPIWVGLLAGACFGYMVGINDVARLSKGLPGIVLPLPGARDSLQVQVILLTIASAVWSGGCAGILLSRGYRRLLMLGLIPTFIFGAIMGIGIGDVAMCGAAFSIVGGGCAILACLFTPPNATQPKPAADNWPSSTDDKEARSVVVPRIVACAVQWLAGATAIVAIVLAIWALAKKPPPIRNPQPAQHVEQLRQAVKEGKTGEVGRHLFPEEHKAFLESQKDDSGDAD